MPKIEKTKLELKIEALEIEFASSLKIKKHSIEETLEKHKILRENVELWSKIYK